MKRMMRIVWTMSTAAAAAASLGFAVYGPVLYPATNDMTETRIEAERWLLFEASRELPWWLGWVPAIRHEAISKEWYLRQQGLVQEHTESVVQQLELAKPPKHCRDYLGDTGSI